MRSEALLRREVSLILSRRSELLKTTDTWTVPTRRATFIFSLWSFYFSYLCFIHERILLENYMCVFWLKHSIRRLVCVSVGVSMFDPTREHDTNPTRVFSG